MAHSEKIDRCEKTVARLSTDTVLLAETKTDLAVYDKEIKKINADIDTTVRTANESYSLTRNMIEFIHKYEPIYIQRQITQAIQNIFPDPNVQWRLTWFNDIKMPLLTTLLMYKSEVSLEENMKKFDKVITLNSLTA